MLKASRSTAATMPLLLACAALLSCAAKGKWSETDQLREELQSANGRIAQLTAERDEARAKLAEADRVRLSTGESLAADAAAALPRCASIEIGRLSALERDRESRAGPYNSATVYLSPLDGLQRFVQIVGTVTLTVDFLPSHGDADAQPARVGGIVLGPAELREAYRSSPMGTHYSIRVPLTAPVPPGAGSAVVTVEFLDALTGVAHRALRVLPVDRTPVH